MGWNDCFSEVWATLFHSASGPVPGAVAERAPGRGTEAGLNHLVGLGFALLPDRFLSQYCHETLDIADTGPFEVHGVNPVQRYGRVAGGLIRPDLFMASPSTLLVGEMRLDTPVEAGHILSHLALMLCEERLTGTRSHLRLQFLVPAGSALQVLDGCGLKGGHLPRGWAAGRIAGSPYGAVLEDDPAALAAVENRVAVSVVPWPAFHDLLERFGHGLDGWEPGEQTLCRLLGGLREELEIRAGTGVLAPLDRWADPDGQLRALADFAPRFTDPDATMGRWGRPEQGAPQGRFIEVTYQPSALFAAFTDMCHRKGWAVDFDWSRWLESAEGLLLTSGPAAVETATPLQLRKLITALLRRNHYAEGAIEDDFESGLLAAIAERGRVLAAR